MLSTASTSVTCITADAPGNVDFYTRVLGLRMVKKSVNQDDPHVYHLFYADEEGHAGSDITFFEYPNAGPGEAGDGMVHTVVWRVGSAAALEFWANRLSAEGHEVEADGESLRFTNPEGLQHELVVSHVDDEPLVAHHPEIPGELALQGFEGVRAYGRPGRETFIDGARASSRRTAAGTRGRRRAAAGSSTTEAPLVPRRRRGGHRPPRRLGLHDGGPPGLARPRRRSRRPPDTDHRPLLVPLDLLPRAGRRPLRDRDARARFSQRTRIRRTSARSSSCRRRSSTCATASSRC